MKRHALRLAVAAIFSGCALGGNSSACGQSLLSEAFDPASSGSVIVAMRPQTPPPQATPSDTTGAGTAQPLGKDDKVKTAQDPNSVPANESGRLSPITMESVRAPIGAANISVDDIGTRIVPEDQAAKLSPSIMPLPGGQDRGIGCLTYRWQAANLHHWPLYFEEPMLERHGQQCVYPALQPAVSGTKFLGNLVMYPYKATLQPALDSRYTLGNYRPGSAAPCVRYTLPWSPRAAMVQGAAVTAVGVGLPW